MNRFASIIVFVGCATGACAGQSNANAPVPPLAAGNDSGLDAATAEALRLTVGNPGRITVGDAGPSASERNLIEDVDASAGEPSGDQRITARGHGACPDWLPSTDASFERFRAQGPNAFPKADASCCTVTTRDVLCRVAVSANHVVGAMSGNSLVGVTEGSAVPWLDVPIRVASHGTMKLPDQQLVRLSVTVSEKIVTLALDQGTCPRPCARGPNACRGAEADATRSCEAIGSYEAGHGSKRP